jgi:hypothetical protein
VRTGNEPSNARSPLRARIGLAIFGIVTSLAGAVLVAFVAPLWVVVLFLAFAVVAGIDLAVVLAHRRQGPHYQPGPAIPAYSPADSTARPRAGLPPTPERIRMIRYFWIMGSCLFLIVNAWSWVRLLSTTAAVVMSAVASVLPPTAVIIANFGVDLPPEVGPPSPAAGGGEVRRPLGWSPRGSRDDDPH